MKTQLVKKVLFVLFLSIGFFACQEDETDQLQLMDEPGAIQSSCTINGPNKAAPNSTLTYNYSVSGFNATFVNWSILSGNMYVSSGQGTSSASIHFNSNFNGGTIRAYGTGLNGQGCSEDFYIAKKTDPPCNPPGTVTINQVSGTCPGDVFTFTANTNVPSSGSYYWTVFNGASILSGQGTKTITVQSPPNYSFIIKVVHTSNCKNKILNTTDLAEFGNCGGGGPMF